LLLTSSIVVAGFSVVSAAILFVTYAFLIRVPTKSIYSIASSALLMASLTGVQYGHLQFFLHDANPFDSVLYRLCLFVIPSMFYLFGRWAILPNEAFRPIMLVHLLPIALFLVERIEVSLPILFMFGVAYSLWFGNVIYGLREQRNQFGFEIFFFGVLSIIALMVLMFGLSISFIDNATFFFFYANAIGLAFMIIVAALIAIPGLLGDLTEAARIRYGASTLGDLDVDEQLAKLDALMNQPEIYQNESLNLSSLATEMGISGHQLSELVNSRLGMGFPRYVREKRVAAAKALLISAPEQSILSISMDTGFRSQSSFYSAFKDITGQSPGDYRKARREHR